MAKKLLIAVSALVLVSSCGSEEKAEPVSVKSVSGVKVQKAETLSVVRKDTFSGVVIPDKEVFLSPKVVGYLKEVKVKAGEVVKKGQLLAVIDSSDIRPDVDRAKAGLKEISAALREVDKALEEVEFHRAAAEANFRLAERTYKRFKKLLEAEAVSKQRFDEVEARYKAAKASLEAVKAKEAQLLEKKKELLAKKEQMEAGLRKARAFLSYTYLKSPFDGVVLQKLVDSGNLVSPQTPVFKLGSFPLKVKAFIDESYSGKIREGSTVVVKIKGKTFKGKVVEVDKSSDPVSHKFGIKVELPDTGRLIPGTYAVVEIPVLSAEEVIVPLSAVYRVGAVEYVFVVEGGVAHLRVIKTGERIGDKVVVLSGLHPGERIAVSGISSLVDGARVEG
ncbi:MAG: efflux RND transporter periplasmic adaptor subunit [Desulfurobacteriaceae bacterium]